jgi:mannose-6-phosphate isomerase-like protein (cupin superfamily)
VREAVRRLEAAGGGYEVIHESPGLELGVYVLLAPTPDTQTPHAFDEVYVVLAGAGEIEIDGARRRIAADDQVFVPAGVEHRFRDFERLVLLVVFNGPHTRTKSSATS